MNETSESLRCPRNVRSTEPLCGGALTVVTPSSAGSLLGVFMAIGQTETTYECQTCGAAWPSSNFNLRWHNGLISDAEAATYMEPLGGLAVMRDRQFVEVART